MTIEDERCAEHRRFMRIHEAFLAGDLEALRAAVDDPRVIPNGPVPEDFAPCLVYAIYWSPLAFGCDPNQRGFNDYTPLHTAVAERNALAVQLLLDRGADPDLRTRIDECETPLEMARSAGLTEIAAILERRGAPLRKRLRSGLTLLVDVPGRGELVRRQQVYPMRLRFWLNGGEPVRWTLPSGPVGVARLEDEGATLITELRIDRRSLVNGLFYGVEGMRVGGMRRLEIAPHLAYGERGVPGTIPPNAVLRAEIAIL